MVKFGVNCAWWDHNTPSENTCAYEKGYVNGGDTKPGKLPSTYNVKFHLDLHILPIAISGYIIIDVLYTHFGRFTRVLR